MLVEFENLYNLPGNPIDGAFQHFCCVFQFLPDGDMLGTMAFAFSAADAIIGGCGIFPGGGAHEMLFQCAELTL